MILIEDRSYMGSILVLSWVVLYIIEANRNSQVIRTWKRSIILLFERFPKSTGAKDMAVMTAAAKVRIDVEKFEIWACHTKHVEAVCVMSVDEVHLCLLGR